MPLINIDLSQIEVIMAAQLSGDKELIKILNEGRDIHKFMVSNLYNEPEESIQKDDPRRSAAKPGTFGILYGNGPGRLSENTGMSIDWCKDFIKTFYSLFPRIKLWHDYLLDQVERKGEIKTPFGSLLKFKKFPPKYKWQDPNKLYYNPPDIKNYPVQHSAQIILALWVGEFFRQKAVFKRDKYLMINTVHDSLMLDCKEEFVDEALQDNKEILDNLKDIIYTKFKIVMTVPIKYESSVANNWYDLK